ncbi:MAG: hypothetical protein EBR82_09635 [Caulobacteraceae bacterium]|nr:hypothetical protein [Caulobacteraceae bacterium]
MNTVAMLITATIAAVYLRRMEQLHYLRNGVSFVLQNAAGAIGGIYSTWDIATSGLSVMHGLMVIMSTLYLIRSQDTYFEEVTKPAPLDDIDDRHLGRVSGGRKS